MQAPHNRVAKLLPIIQPILKQLEMSSYFAGQFCSIDVSSWQSASSWPSIFIT